MSKRHEAKYKIDRRLGQNIWGRPKSPVNRREYGPGQHGQRRKGKPSDFGTQLRAKQKLKGYYGSISEKQFRRYYAEAIRLKGDSGENLIGLLERRLDAVIYRAKFVPTVFAARQFVNHGHITVNGKRVNIASYQVKPGDVIAVKESSKQLAIVIESAALAERDVPDYIDADHSKFSATYTRTPPCRTCPTRCRWSRTWSSSSTRADWPGRKACTGSHRTVSKTARQPPPFSLCGARRLHGQRTGDCRREGAAAAQAGTIPGSIAGCLAALMLLGAATPHPPRRRCASVEPSSQGSAGDGPRRIAVTTEDRGAVIHLMPRDGRRARLCLASRMACGKGQSLPQVCVAPAQRASPRRKTLETISPAIEDRAPRCFALDQARRTSAAQALTNASRPRRGSNSSRCTGIRSGSISCTARKGTARRRIR